MSTLVFVVDVMEKEKQNTGEKNFSHVSNSKKTEKERYMR